MLDTLKSLITSRKMWVGTLTIVSIIVVSALVALGKLDAAQLVPVISAVTATGLGVIGSIAWEDTVTKQALGYAEAERVRGEGVTQTIHGLSEGLRHLADAGAEVQRRAMRRSQDNIPTDPAVRAAKQYDGGDS